MGRGQPSGSPAAASGMSVDVSGGHVTVGDATAHNNALDGWIAKVRVWSVARTSTQINNNNLVELAPTPELVGYWKFNGIRVMPPATFTPSRQPRRGSHTEQGSSAPPSASSMAGIWWAAPIQPRQRPPWVHLVPSSWPCSSR